MAELKDATEPVHIRVAQAVASPFFYHPAGPIGFTALLMLLAPTLGLAVGLLLAGDSSFLPLVPWLFGLAGATVAIPVLGLLVLIPRLIQERREDRLRWEESQRG